jgi:hypothetical protein
MAETLSAVSAAVYRTRGQYAEGQGGRRGRMAAGGAAFDEGPTQGKTGQGQGQGQNYDLALIARASEKFVAGAGEFVKTILRPLDKNAPADSKRL